MDRRFTWRVIIGVVALLCPSIIEAVTLDAFWETSVSQTVNESTTFLETCVTSCTDGECTDTNVSVELYNGTMWVLVGLSGNITINGTQQNPVLIGNFTNVTSVNFSLFANTKSDNNSLRCAVNSTQASAIGNQKNITVLDVISPIVTLQSPPNGSAVNQTFTFRYTPIDTHLANCTLWGNWSGTWASNATTVSPTNGSVNAFSSPLLPFGNYLWNVQCVDTSGASAFASLNQTFLVTVDIEATSFLASNSQPIEGTTITLIATTTNRANRTQNVTLQFWKGHPGLGEQVGGDVFMTLGPYATNTSEQPWTAQIGLYDFFMVVDPPNGSGVIVEFNESNNARNTTVYVSSWQAYYGNTTSNFTLDTAGKATFVFWALARSEGNIYVSDADTLNGIEFATLSALGRNKTSGRSVSTDDDFEQLDTAINTSTLVDSVNRTYTTNGNSNDLRTYTIFDHSVKNVSVANSTSGGEFVTGILWDASDSDDPVYDLTDQEDVVFVTNALLMTSTPYGTVDYVVKVPSRLSDYRSSSSALALYYEVQ